MTQHLVWDTPLKKSTYYIVQYDIISYLWSTARSLLEAPVFKTGLVHVRKFSVMWGKSVVFREDLLMVGGTGVPEGTSCTSLPQDPGNFLTCLEPWWSLNSLPEVPRAVATYCLRKIWTTFLTIMFLECYGQLYYE